MTLLKLGFNEKLKKYREEQQLDSFEIGRVISEHKERYIIKSSDAEYDAELIGSLRYTADNRYDFPAVGDWVAFTEYDECKALIHAIYPRQSTLERQAVGKKGQIQIIATNIDYGLVVQAVDRDFNLNRLERYLTICNASKVEPIIILSKVDLISKSELENLLQLVSLRIKDIKIISVSMQLENGYEQLKQLIQPGKTYCLLGSSGVGKSTLLNKIAGKSLMETGQISSSVNKGKHITSHRELFILDAGGIIIDNPGMREVGIADTASGLETTFEKIYAYAQNCKYKNCTHNTEKACAVLRAVKNGEIAQKSYLNFLKMEKEKAYFESDVQERKKKDKELGKMIKRILKEKKKLL